MPNDIPECISDADNGPLSGLQRSDLQRSDLQRFGLQQHDSQLCNLVESFLKELSVIEAAISSEDLTLASSYVSLPRPEIQVLKLQQHFQQIVNLLAEAVLDPRREQRLRPYQTEAHRLLRLIGVTALKLRTARQPETWQQQRSHLTAQLSQLHPFAQAIADEVGGAAHEISPSEISGCEISERSDGPNVASL